MARRRESVAEAEARLLGLLRRGDVDGFDRATVRARRALELADEDGDDDYFRYDDEEDS